MAKISGLLDEICQKVGGNWLLTGGSLIQLEVDSARATEDIDLVAINHSSLSEVAAQNELFKAAVRLGLSAENVISAASFFVQNIPNWKQNLIELRAGPAGKIFRPNLTLFILLKLGRASPVDLKDIALAVQKYGPAEFMMEVFKKNAEPKIVTLFEANRKNFGL